MNTLRAVGLAWCTFANVTLVAAQPVDDASAGAPAPVVKAVPAETAPADVAPAEVAPAEFAPTDVAPSEVAPSEAAPGDAAPADVAPVEPAPVIETVTIESPALDVPDVALDAPVFNEPFIAVHGFASQGFMLSSGNNFLGYSKRGSFEFSEVGLNFTKQLTDQLRLGVQLFARDLGPIGDYKATLDWFYLDYRFADWLGVRAGRTKLPFGLYNEINDIDAARVPILLPQSVYPITNRDLLLAQTGVELYGYIALGDVGALDYRAYVGTIYGELEDKPPLFVANRAAIPYVAGARLMWETPLPGLRAGFSAQALRIDTYYTLAPGVPPLFEGLGRISFPFRLWVASIEYDHDDLLLSAEYGRWAVNISSNIPGFDPPNVVNERYYLMAAYRVAEWFSPGAYYAGLIPNVDQRDGRAAYRHDFAVTLRFDINPYWLVKVEGHFIHGTADLDETLNGEPASTMQKNWTALFLKTTASF